MKHSLLVAALVAVALSACGKKEEAKPAAAPAPAPVAAPAPAPAPAQPAGMAGMEAPKGMEGMAAPGAAPAPAPQQGMSGMGGMEAKKDEPKK